MIDQDEDYSTLHQEDRAKKEIFREDDEPKRKTKAKAKTKKAKSDSDGGSDKKGVVALPLSMLPQSDEDRAIFTNKSAAFKATKGVARKYDPHQLERFAQGEVIDHKDFGIGFITEEVGLNKMEVVFAKGRKLMIQAPRNA